MSVRIGGRNGMSRDLCGASLLRYQGNHMEFTSRPLEIVASMGNFNYQYLHNDLMRLRQKKSIFVKNLRVVDDLLTERHFIIKEIWQLPPFKKFRTILSSLEEAIADGHEVPSNGFLFSEKLTNLYRAFSNLCTPKYLIDRKGVVLDEVLEHLETLVNLLPHSTQRSRDQTEGLWTKDFKLASVRLGVFQLKPCLKLGSENKVRKEFDGWVTRLTHNQEAIGKASSENWGIKVQFERLEKSLAEEREDLVENEHRSLSKHLEEIRSWLFSSHEPGLFKGILTASRFHAKATFHSLDLSCTGAFFIGLAVKTAFYTFLSPLYALETLRQGGLAIPCLKSRLLSTLQKTDQSVSEKTLEVLKLVSEVSEWIKDLGDGLWSTAFIGAVLCPSLLVPAAYAGGVYLTATGLRAASDLGMTALSSSLAREMRSISSINGDQFKEDVRQQREWCRALSKGQRIDTEQILRSLTSSMERMRKYCDLRELSQKAMFSSASQVLQFLVWSIDTYDIVEAASKGPKGMGQFIGDLPSYIGEQLDFKHLAKTAMDEAGSSVETLVSGLATNLTYAARDDFLDQGEGLDIHRDSRRALARHRWRLYAWAGLALQRVAQRV